MPLLPPYNMHTVLTRYIDQPTEFHSIIYRRSDLDLSTVGGSQCGANHNICKHLAETQNSAIRDERAEVKQQLFKRQANRDLDKVRCWLNMIGDYKFYTAVTGCTSTEDATGNCTKVDPTCVRHALALLTVFVRDASKIFQQTDFNRDNDTDNIQFGIRNIAIEACPPSDNDIFANDYIGVEAFLTAHSEQDWGEYCLSYRFTYRDFDGGVLGLAYVAAQPGSNARGKDYKVCAYVCVCVCVCVCVR